MTDSPTSEKQTVPRSAKLPSSSPEETRKVVAAVGSIGGAVSRARLASHMGVQLTGAISRALGSATLYGFITTDADRKLIITDRGADFVAHDPAKASKAAREALMSTGFGVVIRKLSTRAAVADVVALRLEEDVGIPSDSARDRARLLVKAATKAGLVVNGNFDGGAIEDAIEVVGQPEVPKLVEPSSAQRAKPPRLAEPLETGASEDPPTTAAANGAGKKANGSDATPVVHIAAGGRQAQHVEVPSATPESTKRVVATLAALAGPATRERVASRLNVKLAGRLVSTIVAAQLYGFVMENDDGKLVMTERGQALVGDDENASKRAEQHGIMGTGFGATIQQLKTHQADVEIVAVRLADDQGLSETSASERAKVLVKAATDAGLIANDRFNAEAIEDAVETVGEPPAQPVSAKATTQSKSAIAVPAPPIPQKATPTNGAGSSEHVGEGGADAGPTDPFRKAAPAATLQVVLQIDASKLDAREIGDIVREMRTVATVSTSGS